MSLNEAFLRDGYVVVPEVFAGAELDAMRAEAAAQIEAGTSLGPSDYHSVGTAADGSQVHFRIEAPISRPQVGDALLVGMAHPVVLEVAVSLLGPGALCWSEALLWKGPRGGAAVPMHSAHGWLDPSVSFENLVVDVYLDEATPANGCLKVLPGSHLLSAEENRELIGRGFDVPGLVDVEMSPGDVLFHSEWMIHGSEATGELGRATRRIMYYAFRDAALYAPAGCSPEQRRRVAEFFRRMEIAVERRGGSSSAWAGVPAEWEDEVRAVDDSLLERIGHWKDLTSALA